MKYLFVIWFLTGCSIVPTLVSTGVYLTTDKTPIDHVLSYNTGMDCQTIRVIEKQYVCQLYKVRYVERKK